MKHKILYFSDCHIYGGCDRNIINLLNYIAELENFEVTFAYRYFRTYQMGVSRDLSKKVSAIPLNLLSNDALFYQLSQTVSKRLLKKIIKIILWLQKISLYSFYNYLLIKKTILKIKPDLIHVNNGGYPGSFVCQAAIFAAKHSGINKIIYHINNKAQRQSNLLDRIIDKKINQYTNYFITASKQACWSLSQNRLFDIDKLVQIHNTVEKPNIIKTKIEICRIYNIDIEKFILCEVAFLSQRKGQIYILDALCKIKELYPKIYSQLVLFIVGEGEDYYKLKKFCESNKLLNVIFTGYQTNYADYIACSDIFILPSIDHEDMPLVILSAMNLGKPIIATEVAGIAEEIENLKSGVLIKVEQLSNLYVEIIKLFKDNDLRNYYSENATRRFDEQFSQTRVYGKIQELYSRLLVFMEN